MGFFGYLVDEDGMEVPIPQNNRLRLISACYNPYGSETKEAGKKKRNEDIAPLVLYAKTDSDDDEEEGTIIGVVDPASRNFTCMLGQKFGEEDGALKLWVKGGELYVSGEWTWDEAGCEHEDYDDEEGNSEMDDQSTEEEAPDLVELEEEEEEEEEEERPVATKPVKSGKQKRSEKETDSKNPSVENSAPVAKKAKVDSGLKKWKVSPEGNEGVVVPQPKLVNKDKGLQITDYIIGSGPEPKPGATVKILYEGYLTDGTLFDSKIKRKSPFAFRKGTGQVIKGMDKGLEGMRIGGAREIFVPSALG